jgi:hypothetical protein
MIGLNTINEDLMYRVPSVPSYTGISFESYPIRLTTIVLIIHFALFEDIYV